MKTHFLVSSLIAGFASTAFSAVTITTVALPGGSSAVGSFTMASCYGQAPMLTRSTADNFIESPGYLCIESSDLGIPGDLNGDVHNKPHQLPSPKWHIGLGKDTGYVLGSGRETNTSTRK